MKFLLIAAALLFLVANVAECKPAETEDKEEEVPKTEGEGNDSSDASGDGSGDASGDASSSNSNEPKAEEAEKGAKAAAGPAAPARKRRALADNTLTNLHSIVNAHHDMLAAAVAGY